MIVVGFGMFVGFWARRAMPLQILGRSVTVLRQDVWMTVREMIW